MPAKLLYLIFLLGFHSNLWAINNPDNFRIVKDLGNDLLIYDEAKQTYVSYLGDKSLKIPIASLAIDLKLYSGYYLKIKAQQDASLFIQQKLVDYIGKNGEVKYNIDSLENIYQKDSLFITAYNPKGKFQGFSFQIISLQPEEIAEKKSTSPEFFISTRQPGDFNDFFISGIIVLLILITILFRANPKYFNEFYNIPKAVSLKIREEAYLSVRYITGTYISFMMIQSFILGFIIINLIHYTETFKTFFIFIETTTLLSSLLGWMQLSGIIFISFLLKYFLVKSISQLFNLKGFSTIHFFDFFRLSISFFLLVLIAIITLISAFSFEDLIWIPSLIKIIVIFYIFRMILLFLKLYKYAPFRNLHLILYICSTELLPLLVGFKIFIND